MLHIFYMFRTVFLLCYSRVCSISQISTLMLTRFQELTILDALILSLTNGQWYNCPCEGGVRCIANFQFDYELQLRSLTLFVRMDVEELCVGTVDSMLALIFLMLALADDACKLCSWWIVLAQHGEHVTY
ncbi:hypothetical protein M758_12G085700 [Ceratodon purpureus]|nr:hypothetical protein M758_12G085700 [Ceratodon purpureus]